MKHLLQSSAIVLSLMLPTHAMAESATQQTVTRSADVAAGPADVWDAVGDFQDMSWHPAVYATEGENGNETDGTRVLTIGQEGGGTISEILVGYDADQMTYSYRIEEVAMDVLPVTDYASQLSVTARDGGGSTVEWSGDFHRGHPGEEPPEDLNDAAAVAAVGGVYQLGLDALVERFGAPES